MKYLLLAGVSSLVIILSCSSQKTAVNTTPVSQLVDKQQYTFVAREVFPMEDSRYNPRLMLPGGSNLYHLTSRYDLRVTPDSVIAYLPFFGRAYTAPLDPSEGGIKFTSTKFSYKKSMRKNNFEIEITPQDNTEVRSLFLTISQSGSASLRITNLNKTPIAFNGDIEANK
jgi:hypothetical protein